MQSTCGRILFIVPATLPLGSGAADGSDDLLALELIAMYEAKVGRLIEEITKARIEGRFSEQEREGGKWTLRSPPTTPNTTGILACVCEDGQSVALNHAQSSSIRLVFDTPKSKCTEILNGSNLDVVLSITASNGDQFKLEIDSVIGSPSLDLVSAETFVPTLSKRRKCHN
jgi:hypothetical protein